LPAGVDCWPIALEDVGHCQHNDETGHAGREAEEHVLGRVQLLDQLEPLAKLVDDDLVLLLLDRFALVAHELCVGHCAFTRVLDSGRVQEKICICK
jgi:hypothetical protein